MSSLKRACGAILVTTPLPRVIFAVRRLWQILVRPTTLGAQAMVVDGCQRVLLVHHTYAAGWHLPGGGVQKGETAAAGAMRELREETGLVAMKPVRLLGLYGRFNHGGSDHIAVYVVTAWSGMLKVDGLEIDDARFWSMDALPVTLSPATGRRLAEFRGETACATMW